MTRAAVMHVRRMALALVLRVVLAAAAPRPMAALRWAVLGLAGLHMPQVAQAVTPVVQRLQVVRAQLVVTLVQSGLALQAAAPLRVLKPTAATLATRRRWPWA